MIALSCPECRAPLAVGDREARCPGCATTFPVIDGIPSFLDAAPDGVEEGYAWDYATDPRITPLTVARWRLLTRVLDRVEMGPVVVAVGGGGEHWPARRLDGRVAEYVVVDTSLPQLRRQWFPSGARAVAVRAAGERLPLPDSSADTVELWGVLDHFVDPVAAVAETARVVRPGGNVVIALGNDGSWYRRLAGRFGPSDSDAHHHRFDLAAIERMLGDAFRVTMVETLGYVRLPVRAERALARRLSTSAQDLAVTRSDAALRRLFGPHAGGMILVVAQATSRA